MICVPVEDLLAPKSRGNGLLVTVLSELARILAVMYPGNRTNAAGRLLERFVSRTCIFRLFYLHHTRLTDCQSLWVGLLNSGYCFCENFSIPPCYVCLSRVSFGSIYIVCDICNGLPLSTCFLWSPRFTHLPTPLVAPFTASKFLETVCMPWIRSFLPHFLSHSDMNIAFDGDDEPRPLLTGIQSKVRRLFLFYLNVLPANSSTMSAWSTDKYGDDAMTTTTTTTTLLTSPLRLRWPQSISLSRHMLSFNPKLNGDEWDNYIYAGEI